MSTDNVTEPQPPSQPSSSLEPANDVTVLRDILVKSIAARNDIIKSDNKMESFDRFKDLIPLNKTTIDVMGVWKYNEVCEYFDPVQVEEKKNRDAEGDYDFEVGVRRPLSTVVYHNNKRFRMLQLGGPDQFIE